DDFEWYMVNEERFSVSKDKSKESLVDYIELNLKYNLSNWIDYGIPKYKAVQILTKLWNKDYEEGHADEEK
ncbi:MAG: hypothetical protein HUJ93_08495, partial [Bacteroidales bacterium]|nr:hypothetical protein [Bacteroidales bacterium]